MKMFKTVTLVICIFFIVLKVNAQFRKTYGFEQDDYAQTLLAADDSSMYLIGALGYISKVDTSGQIIWENEVHHNDDWYFNIIKDAIISETNNFIIIGNSIHKGGKGHNSFIMKFNSSGDTIFSNAFGIEIGECDVNSIIQTKDGGYAIIGYSTIQGYRNKDILLIKTDGTGKLMWSKTYGGDKEDNGVCLVESNEEEFILVGETESFGESGKSIYILKTNNSGDTIWSKTIGGNRYDTPTGIIKASSNEYLISGTTSSYGVHYHDDDMFLLRIGKNGNSIWSKTYGGDKDDICNKVIKTGDNELLLVGSTESFGHGQKDVMLVKADLNGNTIYSKAYGGSSIEEGKNLCIHKTGNYIFGDTRTFSVGNKDMCIIHIDENGESQCKYKDATITYSEPVWNEYVGVKVGSGCYEVQPNLTREKVTRSINNMCDCQPPKANFHISQTDGSASYTDESTWLGTWFWDFGDGQTSTEQNPSHWITNGAKVCLTVQNPCGTDTYCEYVYGGAGIQENNQELLISIFPNPARNFIDINLVPGLEINNIEILNAIGAPVLRSENINQNTFRINIGDLNKGAYFARILMSTKEIITKKIIIE